MSSMNVSSKSESTKCPVCFEIYPGKIFQCSKGHAICHLCYEKCLAKTKNCPTCQIPFGKEPIRCLVAEGIMGELGLRKKLDCPFKSSGCGKKVDSNLVEEHADGCKYNFQKFGPLINICKSLHHDKCSFTVNKSNVAEWIEHARQVHNNVQYFEKELPSGPIIRTLLNAEINSVDSKFLYYPSIYDFKKESFAIIIRVNKRDDLFITPFILNYAAEAEKTPKCEIKFTFTTSDDDRFGSKKIKMSTSPVDILKIEKFQMLKFGCAIPIVSLEMERARDDENYKNVRYLTEIVLEK